MPPAPRTVLCMKWGTLYGPVYVNILYRALRDHLGGPFRFVCLTDDAEGLTEGVEAFPIPDMGIDESYYRAGAWPKIGVFKPELHDIQGRVLFIDLDTLIVGPMDRFFATSDAFNAIGGSTWPHDRRAKPWVYRVWKDLRRAMKRQAEPPPVVPAPAQGAAPAAAQARGTIGPSTMGTGIFGFEAGTLGHVYDRFVADPAGARARFEHEQHYVEHQLDSWVPWPTGSVVSFKRNLRQPLLVDLIREPHQPGPDTPVLAFHGDPRPIDMATRRVSKLSELPHVWFGPVSWVRAYWDRYAG